MMSATAASGTSTSCMNSIGVNGSVESVGKDSGGKRS